MSYRLEFEPVANFLEEVFAMSAYDHKTATLIRGVDAVDALALRALYGHFPQVQATMELLGRDYAAFKQVVTLVGAGGREAQYVKSVQEDEAWWKRVYMSWTAAAAV
jgi:hypothetical protein